MSVRKDDMINLAGLEPQIAIHGVGLLSLALKHSAVEEDFFTVVEGDQSLAAGHFACSAEEFYFHNSKDKLLPKSN